MSHVRSRSPRHKREHSFSISSLSSGSHNESHTPYSSRRQSRSNRDRRNNSREQLNEWDTSHDKERNRVKDKEHSNEKYSGYENYRNKEKFRESPEEESYLKPMPSFHKEHEIRTNISERHMSPEECMLDPSTCNFGSTSYIEGNIAKVQDEPVGIEEKKIRDDTDNRLERLEKLVELLVNNNSNKSQSQTNTSQESSFSLNTSIFELVPRDTNFTTSMWLNKVHEECINRNFDEKTSIQFLESNMTGIIKAWYKTIPSYDFTWPELKMLITKTFPDNTDFASTLKLLVGRKKKLEESVTQYYFSKMYLLEACKISGINAVSCLIDGLENEYFRKEAKSHNFLTPEALYSQFLLNFAGYHHQDIPEITEYEEVYTTEPAYMENRQDDQKYRKSKNTARKCFTCGKFGHLTADCRHAPHCYNCKKEGHIAVNCPLKYRKALMISIKNELDKSNYMLCYVNGKKLQAYIDTGCSVITIKERVAQDLKLKFNSCQQIIQGYGGGFVRALGEVKLHIKVDLVECILPAVVVADDIQTVPLIIGQPLLHKNNVVMVLHNSGIRLFERKCDESYLKIKLYDFDTLQEN